jgi:hypothetical protein
MPYMSNLYDSGTHLTTLKMYASRYSGFTEIRPLASRRNWKKQRAISVRHASGLDNEKYLPFYRYLQELLLRQNLQLLGSKET